MRVSHSLIGCLVAMGLLVGASACAPAYSPRGDGGAHRMENRGHAYSVGGEAGRRLGLQDAKRGRRSDFEQQKAFRDADKGYGSRDGNRNDYRESFRAGYTAAYNDAFQTNARDRDRDDDRKDRGRRR